MDKKAEVLKLCQDTLGAEWTGLSLDSIELEVVSGGLSNYLFKCSIKQTDDGRRILSKTQTCPTVSSTQLNEDEKLNRSKKNQQPEAVLVRYYGVQENDHEAILKDSLVFALLSEKGLGPKLYGVFENGRLEEYIPSRSLRTAEMSEKRNMAEIARKMAALHRLKMPFCAAPNMLRMNMTSMYSHVVEKPPTSANNGCDSIWAQIHAREIGKELDWLLTVLYNGDFPVRFCHNDVHEGNLLVPKDRDGLVLIDYEYANYNFRGFDFSNHFMEWTICYDHAEDPFFLITPESYPSEEQQIYTPLQYTSLSVLM